MNEKAIFLFARELGCCEGCSVRCLGVKNPNVYMKLSEYVKTFYDDVPVQASVKPEPASTEDISLPADLQTLPIMKEDSDSEIQPVNMEIQSENSEIQPVNSEIQPVNSEIQLVNSEIQPVNSEIQLVNSEIQPVNSELQPVNMEIQSVNSEIQSVNSEIQSQNSELKSSTENSVDKATKKRSKENEGSAHAKQKSGLDPGPPVKRRKWPVCVCCLGIMQQFTWPQCYQQVQEVLGKKMYECATFACALSAPLSTILREKAITLLLKDKYTEYDCNSITPLKEAWKWCFGSQLEKEINKALDSGSISPLLIQLNIDYVDESEELEIVKRLAPDFFKERSYRGKHRFPVEFTKRSVEQALDSITATEMKTEWQRLTAVNQSVTCVSVACTHVPLYLGGRYIKLSRELCQTPWILNGKRMMESSVQDIIFDEIAKVLHVKSEDVDHRLKFLSAGREDVDVRCLGNGRPFAVEFSDPRRFPTADELQTICDSICDDGRILVKQLALVSREDLTILKQGEETKNKTYEALCIKLGNSKTDSDSKQNGCQTIEVTKADIDKINSFTNLPPGEGGKLSIVQKTPIRVLHRRPLLERKRFILELEAKLVPEHPKLFTIRVKTSAGTYVKEWVHGELGRAKPCLGSAIDAPVDILALDVMEVHLDWPPVKTR